jgi:methylmalonyl-CoA/ethylmalonyl-CoA epimerase
MEEGNMIKKVNHIAIVVSDLDESLRFWVDALGLKLAHTEHVASQAVDVAFVPVGDSKIELLKPTDSESGVARYLEKRGAGMHHLCFEVDDIVATLTHLKEVGVQLINEAPVVGSDGRKFAFIHPKSANGVLVELYELTGA